MSGSIIRRGKWSWRIKFDIGRGSDGKRQTRYLTVRGTRKDAEKALIDALKAVSDRTFVDPTKVTVGEYLERWLTDHAATAVGPKTLERYSEICRQHLIPALGAGKLTHLQPLDIQGYYAHALVNGRVRGGGLSPRTVHHHHILLKQALKRAVKWRLLSTSPAEDVDPPQVEETEIQILGQNEVPVLLEAARSTRLHVPTALALTTGMRRGEVLAVRWQDIDLDKATLNVSPT